MNRLGMLVDLSHVSADTMKRRPARQRGAGDLLALLGARHLATHPRNVPDDVLPLVKKNGGVVMVNFSRLHRARGRAALPQTRWPRPRARRLRPKSPHGRGIPAAMEAWDKANPVPTATRPQVADHIDHIVKVAGIDHVGLGSDFDGMDSQP